MELLNQMKELNYKRTRINLLKQCVAPIGLLEEKDDCIICYVRPERLVKKDFYELICNGPCENLKDLVSYFQLNKPIYYIFDGITFDKGVNLSSIFTRVIFRNCTFHDGIRILSADHVIFEKNKYHCWTDCKKYGDAFLWGSLKSLTIQNEQFVNDFNSQFLDNNFGIHIEADQVNVDHSYVCTGNHGQVNIKAKETHISQSKIMAPEIYLDSDSINFCQSRIKTDGILIENKNSDCDIEQWSCDIDSPYLVYNGKEIGTSKKELQEKRYVLVRTLGKIFQKCQQETLVKLASVKDKKKSNFE